MTAEGLPYFKFITELIDSGLWARMSPAARTLYPTLLRFSDGNFKPVYPGTRTLLKLTGFKQKSTIKRARRELERLGLIVFRAGTGRTNTHYCFRFDFDSPGEGEKDPLWGSQARAPGGVATAPQGPGGSVAGEGQTTPSYNKIEISINNNPEPGRDPGRADRFRALEQRFGEDAVRRARSECELGELPDSPANVERLLLRETATTDGQWDRLMAELSERISPSSYEAIQNCYLAERDGMLVLKDTLPAHLKVLLMRLCKSVFFEPSSSAMPTRREFWVQQEKVNE